MTAPGDTHEQTQTLQSLCLSCGMCCDGTLFECVELEPDEYATFAASPLVAHDGRTAAPLPCVMHRARVCVVYERRPSRCKKFTCKLYEAVKGGAVSEADAVRPIAEARQLFQTLEKLLGWLPGSFSTKRFREWAAEYPGGEGAARRAFPQAFLKYGVLRLLMERHFIHAGT